MHVHEHHKHVTLWISVGVTMSIIIAFWAFGLPSQLSEAQAREAKAPSRWSVVVPAEKQQDQKGLLESIDDLGAQLDQAERQLKEESAADTKPSPDEAAVDGKVEELKKKVESTATATEESP